jgi:hypothetical protein
MASYIDKYKDTIKPKQIEQVLKVLNRQKDDGEIRSLEEFTQKLDSLVRELTQATLTPTLKILQPEQKTDSEIHNFMLDRVEDDLTVVFDEAQNLEVVQTAHHQIIVNNTLKKLRDNLAILNTKMDVYEFIANNTYGFDSAIFSVFGTSKNDQLQKNELTKSLFIDPKTGKEFPETEIAHLGLDDKELTLRTAIKNYFNIISVIENIDEIDIGIFDTTYFPLENAIDNDDQTFASKEIISLDSVEYKTLVLELSLEGIKSINFLELSIPESKDNLRLYSIKYLDNDNVIQTISIPDVRLTAHEVFRFLTVSAQRIYLEFRNYSGTYFENKFEKEIQWNNIPIETNVYKLLKDNISSNFINANALPQITIQEETIKGWKYLFNFISIKCGFIKYEPKTCYISQPFEIEDVMNIGLKTDYQIPLKGTDGVFLYDKNEIKNNLLPTTQQYLGNIEYWIVKEDLDDHDNKLSNLIFRILPLNKTIFEDLIFLTWNPFSLLSYGYYMFLATRVSNSVLRLNSINLTYPTDYSFLIEYKPPNDNKELSRIRIYDIKNSDGYSTLSDICTLWNTFQVSSTVALPRFVLYDPPYNPFSVSDLAGDLSIRWNWNNVIGIEKFNPKIRKYRFYLMIILRQTFNNQSVTPIVNNYKLFFGKIEQDKFKGI